MSLATYTDPAELYLARGDEVNPNRPLFTGDVVLDVAIPGVQDAGPAIFVAHPCSIRGATGQLLDRTLVAAVRPHEQISRKNWPDGFYDRSPLPETENIGYCVTWLDHIGRAETDQVVSSARIACLSEYGINILQQRLTFHLTRVAIPTHQFHEAFAHTMIEADLLEEWIDTVTTTGRSASEAVSLFEEFIRRGDPSLQNQLLDPERRASVRVACAREARSIVGR